MRRVYLDHSATTPVRKEVIEIMQHYLEESWGNPSTLYSFGREAKKGLEEARERVAKLIGAVPQEIIFTSGGTEADNMAIIGAARANEKKGKHIITSSIEHHAALDAAKYLEKHGYEVTFLPVTFEGLIKLDDVKKAIRDDTALISIMHVNNEIGTIQPIAEIGKLAREKGIIFHTDAVQSVGKIPVDVHDLHVDLLSISSHKIYGPKGVGALYVRKGTRISPLVFGGGQERKRRPGTENMPGIVGFGLAAELIGQEMEVESRRERKLRDKLIEGILNSIPDVQLNGDREQRAPNNVNVSVRYIEGESLLLSLDMQGIAASSGSACTSGSLDPSHVLLSLGLTHEVAHGSLRMTLGKETTEEDVDYVLDVLPGIVVRLRNMSPLYHQKLQEKESAAHV